MDVTVAEFVVEVMDVARLSGKSVGRSLPRPISTPAPTTTQLSAAGSLQAAIDSLPEIARVELADDVFGVIPGHVERVPLELDPIAGTDFAVYHVPSGSWTWFHEDDVPIDRAYRSLEAIEAIESVVRDPELIATLRDRVPPTTSK
ncbi:MAG: hypothetical protein HOC77_11790 [Chloroflexi bacterium]|nr:hypothetical protein [Chloroflexota bacterium]MBT4073637.1 hypothetical protein [Chloroflexota bacterium]MBT4515758.1 hypothetical protein [Chloroflexota bacterium]MBT5319239.1 hypothetical protein [Chloroflexota bacterium]MBT6682515.1 hypothetical protein [Chloroflexota bacterium]